MFGGAAARRAAIAVVLVVLVAIAWSRFGPEKWSGPWQAPVDLSDRSDEAFAPQVEVDGRRNAVAVWYARTSDGVVVQSATRPAGGSWRGPVDLSSGSRNAGAPRLDVGAQGTAVAVWESDRIAYVGPRVILSAVREPGERWGPPVRLSAAEGAADAPQVAVDPEGNATAVWTKHRGSGKTRVQSSVRRRGGTWQKPVDIGEISVESHGGSASPVVAVDARGNAAAAWTNVGEEDQGIVQSAVRPAGRGWQPPVSLSRPNHRTSASRVMFDARGNVVVRWADYTDLRVRSATRRVNGTWTAPVDLVDANTTGGGLAVSPRGRQTIRWTIHKGGTYAVASRSAGGRWRKRDDLAVGEEIRGATFVVDDEGNAAAIWLTGEGGDAVRAALMPADEDWQETRDIAPHASTSEASGAEVTAVMDQDGRVIAVWGREMYLRGGRINVVQAAIHGPP